MTETTSTSSAGNLRSTADRAVGQVKDTVAGVAQAVADAGRSSFDKIGEAAKDSASQAASKMQEGVETQKAVGVDYARKFASNIRNASKAFEQDTPLAAQVASSAADYLEQAAGKFEGGSVQDVIEGVTNFARKQPAAFLGLSVLAGFAAIRFLKASGSATTRGDQ